MEKFSKFNDPSSGINPFIQPKQKPLLWFDYIKFIILYPIYLLSIPFPFLLRVIFTIKVDSVRYDKISIGICNSSSYFDKRILRHVLGIKNFYFVRDGKYYTSFEDSETRNCKKLIKPCVLFVEGTMTNNRAILQYETPTKIDFVCFIKYSSVFVYGSWFRYLVGILSNGLTVEFRSIASSDPKQIAQLGNVPIVKFNYKDRKRFMNTL